MKDKRTPPHALEEIMPLLISIWRRFHKEPGPGDKLQTREFRSVVAAVQEIQKGDYDFTRPELLGAYLLYNWVVHYQQALSLLGELPETPKRVLDLCAGPAAFSFAALRHGAREVIATDSNLRALELGSEVCGRFGMPITIRKWDCLKSPLPIEGKFDLIILGHCLEELFPDPERGQQPFIEMLLKRLTPTGHLLIVDSSFPEQNKRILKIRDALVKAGVPVQAPCVWRGECPALATTHNPCYAQREFEKPYLIKEIQRAAEINLSSLKMSYILFKSPESSWMDIQDAYRVISPPVDTYQGKRYYLCGTDGKKTIGSHFEKQPKESRCFDYLRRGELISIKNALVKQNAMDIVEGTEVVVRAACGKPLS